MQCITLFNCTCVLSSLDWQSQYIKANPDDYLLHGPYDYYSVMHYPPKAPRTGKPAFLINDMSIDISRVGQREGPTATDIRKINNLYS